MKLRLPTAEESRIAKTPLLARAVIEEKWAEKYPNMKMFGSQQMMLIVLMTYLGSATFKDSMVNGCLAEPMIFSLGFRSGATTLINVIREAYPDLVRVIVHSRNLQLSQGGDYYSNGTKTKPPLKDKFVIFDGNLLWHDRKFIDHVRSSMPLAYISIGA